MARINNELDKVNKQLKEKEGEVSNLKVGHMFIYNSEARYGLSLFLTVVLITVFENIFCNVFLFFKIISTNNKHTAIDI